MMTRKMAGMVGVLMLAGLAGCVATGREPSYKGSKFQMIVGEETVVKGPEGELSEKEVQAEIDRLWAMKPAAPVPSKVLLFEVASSGVSKMESAQRKILLRKETSEAMKGALEKTGTFEQVDFLPEIYLPAESPNLKILRVAAARAHADGLLIYSTEAGYDYRPNALSPLYLTIVGAFVVPGSRGSALAVSKAVLVDVKTGYIYRVLESYGEASATRPVALLDEEGLEFEARKQALGALAGLIGEKVKGLGPGRE